eukprot:TRINITY_DN8740_c0_g1_i1.p1 TRINITY_DN8740_c0_g1~~TRINITY_DN8740_c0_g1_i1.p1  ORF type:complete len:1094 (-),score=123.02 TRINITY_DN8740_c0_g1_i1:113-3394(-)
MVGYSGLCLTLIMLGILELVAVQGQCSGNTIYSTGDDDPLRTSGCSPNYDDEGDQIGYCCQCYFGTYAYGGVCTICPAGTYNVEPSIGCPLTCPPGSVVSSISSDNQASFPTQPCTSCPSAYYNTASTQGCFACPFGTSSSSGATSCSNCTQGTYNCTAACSSGYIPNPTVSSCSPCDANEYSAGNATCIPCASNAYSNGAAGYCLCSAGTFSPSPALQACTECSPGSFSANNATACTLCDIGTACASNDTNYYQYATEGIQCSTGCYDCVPGTYANATGLLKCLPCRGATYASDSGMLNCLPCEAGYGVGTGSMGYIGNTGCSPCPNGSASAFGQECSLCPPGTYAAINGQSSCTPCAGGTFSAETGATICSGIPQPGSFSAAGSTASSVCAPGSYATVAGMSSCTLCPRGTWNYLPGGFGSYYCTACSPGYANNVTGASSCTTCPKGTYSLATGTFVCPNCPTGTYCEFGQVQVCLPGTFNPFEGGGNSSACLKCPAGTYQSQTAQSTCLSCPANAVTAQPGLSACTACPVGTSSLPGASSCVQCFYNMSQCSQCPAGTYGAPQGSTCFPCPEGLFSSLPDVMPAALACLACPAGTYQPYTGSLRSNCTLCPAGSFSTAVGQADAGTCAPCSTGSICLPGSVAQLPASLVTVTANGWQRSDALIRNFVTGSTTFARVPLTQYALAYVQAGYARMRDVSIVLCSIIAMAFLVLAFVTAWSGPQGRVRAWMMRADVMFASKHNAVRGEPIIVQRTAAGGFFTLVLGCFVCILWLYLLITYSRYNTAASESLISGEATVSTSTNVTLTLSAFGYGGSCTSDIVEWSATGLDCASAYVAQTSLQSSNANCTVVLVASDCIVTSSPASVRVNLTEANAYASMMQWNVSSTTVVPHESNSVGGFIQSKAGVMRGSVPVVNTLLAYRTTYTDLSGTVQGGLRLYSGTITNGSVASTGSFYAQDPLLAFEIQLSLFSGYASVVSTAPTTFVQFATSMFALPSTFLTAITLMLFLWERVLLARMARGLQRLRSYSARSGAAAAKTAQLGLQEPFVEMREMKDVADADESSGTITLQQIVRQLVQEELRRQHAPLATGVAQ